MNLLQSFSVLQISRVARRTALSAVAAGLVALGVCAVVGYPIAGAGVCIGLALALGNIRFTGSAAAKAVATENVGRRPLALNTLARLSVVTVVAVGLLLLQVQLGFGTLLGLAIFQFIMLANMTVTLLKNAALPVAGISGPGSAEDD
jgi:hypothetical protein